MNDESTPTNQPTKTRRYHFDQLSPEKKFEIAQKGGRSAHAQGKAHKWTSKEASAAGKKGGKAQRRSRTS